MDDLLSHPSRRRTPGVEDVDEASFAREDVSTATSRPARSVHRLHPPSIAHSQAGRACGMTIWANAGEAFGVIMRMFCH